VRRLAEKLDGSVRIGEALSEAKRAYYLPRLAFSAYDEKVLSESTFYGLPMYGVGLQPPSLDGPQPPAPPAPTPPDHVRGTSASTEPSTSTLQTDSETGLQSAA